LFIGAGVAREYPICQKVIQFSQNSAVDHLIIGELSFLSTTERSTITALATLATAKPVNRLFLLVEVLDEQGHPITSIPVVAETRSELSLRVPEKLEFFIRTRRELEGPAQPGQTLNLVGQSEYVLTACPAQARLAVLDLHYSDGTGFHHSEPGWVIQSDVRHVQPMDVPNTRSQRSRQYLASVSLDQNGRITAIEKLPPTENDDEDLLKVQLSNWKFNAKVENGDNVASELNLLFRFHATDFGEPGVRGDDHSINIPVRSFIPVDVFQPARNGKKIIAVGGMPISY
jgi:hypothetical protein